MNRVLAALLAVFLSGVLALVPSYVSPVQAAEVVKTFVCTSSIDPRCNPANLPILIELGIVQGGAGTGTAVVTGTAAGGAPAAGLIANGAVGLGITGIFACVLMGECETGIVKATSKTGGVEGLLLETDPLWTPPAGWTCNWPTTRSSVDGGPSIVTTLASACNNLPLHQSSTVAVGSLVVRGDFQFFGTVSGREFTAIIDPVGTPSGGWSVAYRLHCSGAFSTIGPVTYVTGGASGTPVTLANPTLCPSGLTPQAAVVQVGTGSEFWVGTGWNYLEPTPSGPADPNIRGQAQTTIECLDPATSDTLTVTVPSDAQVVTPGDYIAVPDAYCPAGWINTETRIDWKPFGETDWEPIVEPTPTHPEIVELPTEYPDCFPAPAGQPCELTLWQVQPNGDLDYCGGIGQLCIGWAQSPQADDRYQCRYGNYVIDLNKCSAYRFPDEGILPNVDADGDTIPYNAPRPAPDSNPVLDPLTGTPVVPAVPGPGAEIEPGRSNCFPTGWGVLNPASWVLQPLRCALEWAFVPRPSVAAAAQSGWNAKIGLTVLGQIGTVTDAFVDMFEVESGGCQGPPFRFRIGGDSFPGGGIDETYYPFSACDEPMAGFATIFNFLSLGLMFVAAQLASIRYTAAAFGFVGWGTRVDHDAGEVKSTVRFR